MSYTPIQANIGSTPAGATTTMAPKGINLHELPQLLNANEALNIENYLITAQGQLVKRGGLQKIFEVAGDVKITMLEKYTDDILIFGYGTTVARYTISTDTVTNIKTDFSSNNGFNGARYGEYFLVVNGVDKMWRMDNAFAITEISASPISDNLLIANNRVVALALSTNKGAAKYSATDDGTDPPFSDWTEGVLADDAGTVYFRNAGDIQSAAMLGDQIVVLADDGKWAFYINTIDSAGALTKIDIFTQYRIDSGGSRGAINTSSGLFYVNEAGLWQLISVGQPNIPYSDQEKRTSVLLGNTFFDDLDLSDASLVHDAKRGFIFLTCRQNSATNNLVLAYSIETQAFMKITGWNVERWLNIGQTIYGASSIKTAVYKCFTGADDDGLEIGTDYLQEIKLGDLFTRQVLQGCYVQGLLSESTSLKVRFDIYDRTGKLIKDKAQFTWTSQNDADSFSGWGTAAWGGAAWGGDVDTSGLIESFDGCRPFIRNFQRVRLHITGSDTLPHTLNWVSLSARVKANIRRRKLTKIT
jgi:hypothetical protein